MAYISYNEWWENQFNNLVSKNDKLQDMNNNQLKLEVHDRYKKDEKITTDFSSRKVSSPGGEGGWGSYVLR